MRRVLPIVLCAIAAFLLSSSPIIAANNPGHDTLYVEEQGDSLLNGSLNITANLSILGRTDAGALMLYGDGTSPGSGTFIASSAGGTDLLRINAPGNLLLKSLGGGQVAIGSSTATDLNVTGAIYAYGNRAVCLENGTGCPASALGGGNVTGSGSANYVPRWTSGTDLGNSIIWANTTNVGIGTSNPTYTLDVSGSTYLHGTQHLIQSTTNLGLRLADGVNTQWMYLIQDTAGSLIFQNGSGAGGEKVTIMQNGNVGIGTTAPAGTLDVNNTVDGVGIIVTGVNGQSTNLQEWKNHTGFTYAAITGVDGNAGNLKLNSPVGQSNGAEVEFTSEGGTYNGSVGIDGGGNYVLRQSAAGSMFFDYYTNAFFRTYPDYTYRMTLTSTGNLGIGTWPTQKLDVNGSINVSGGGRNIWIDNSRVCTEDNGLCGSAGSAGGWTNTTTQVYLANNATNVSVGTTPTLFFDTTHNRLGYKTLTPQAPLDFNMTTGEVIRIGTTAGTGYTSLSVDTGVGSVTLANQNGNGGITLSATARGLNLLSGGYTKITSGSWLNLTATNALSLQGNALFVNSSSKNIGIGTFFPTQALDVNGSINISGASGKIYAPEICLNGNCQTSWPSGADGTGGWTNTTTATSTALDVSITTGNLTITSGNVGIGTATPTSKLEVNGSVNITSGNMTVQATHSVCFTANCSARIYFNGTALIIEGQA